MFLFKAWAGSYGSTDYMKLLCDVCVDATLFSIMLDKTSIITGNRSLVYGFGPLLAMFLYYVTVPLSKGKGTVA